MAALQVELADKGLHDLSQHGAARHFREVASAAQHFALTDKQHMHAGHAGIEGDADHVEVVTGVGDKLFLRHAADGLNLVADARGLFELQVLARLLHPRDELGQHLVILAGEKQPHILYLLSILFFADQPGHARPQAATNLILQTGAGAIAVDAVFTLTDGKDFLQQRQVSRTA